MPTQEEPESWVRVHILVHVQRSSLCYVLLSALVFVAHFAYREPFITLCVNFAYCPAVNCVCLFATPSDPFLQEEKGDGGGGQKGEGQEAGNGTHGGG